MGNVKIGDILEKHMFTMYVIFIGFKLEKKCKKPEQKRNGPLG